MREFPISSGRSVRLSGVRSVWASGRGSHDPPTFPPSSSSSSLYWATMGGGGEGKGTRGRWGKGRISDVRIEDGIWIKKGAVLVEKKVV